MSLSAHLERGRDPKRIEHRASAVRVIDPLRAAQTDSNVLDRRIEGGGASAESALEL